MSENLKHVYTTITRQVKLLFPTLIILKIKRMNDASILYYVSVRKGVL